MHHQLGIGQGQVGLGLLDGELVGLELHLRHIAAGGQPLAMPGVLLARREILFGHECCALQRLFVLLEGALFVLFLGDFGVSRGWPRD